MNKQKIETLSQKQSRLALKRIAYREFMLNETSEHRIERLEKQKNLNKKRKIEETEEQRNSRLLKNREAKQRQLSKETPDQRILRLNKEANRISVSQSNETSQNRTIRLEKNKNYKNTNLQKHKQHQMKITKKETSNERTERLKLIREAKQLVRANVETFDDDIFVFAETICEVCLKRCYPKQCSSLAISKCGYPNYLPQELLSKDHLLLCHRCKTHLITNKRSFPSKAFWNDLDPGIIPDELKECTQVELRIMSRIIPFIKIIKLDGVFGQYSFKGQAILFAQDVFEITESLPNMLPRTAETSGIVIVLEELENLNIFRELEVNKQRVSTALDWLIQNNPLYKDVQNVSASVNIQATDFMRKTQPHANNETDIVSAFKTTNLKNPISRIVRSSWNQSDRHPFGVLHAGRQCTAMCLSAIIKIALGTCASSWNNSIINNVLLNGHELYEQIIVQSEVNNVAVPESGYLLVNNFDLIKTSFTIFETNVQINYDADPAIFGKTEKQNFSFMPNLHNGLVNLFQEHKYGIIISESKSLAVMFDNEKLYFFDSHGCGAAGAPAQNGKACFIECDSFEELLRICKRSISKQNAPYTLDFIDVELLDDSIATNNSTNELNGSIHDNIQVDQGNSNFEINPIIMEDNLSNAMTIRTSVMLYIECHQPQEQEVLQNDPQEKQVIKILRKTTNIFSKHCSSELRIKAFCPRTSICCFK